MFRHNWWTFRHNWWTCSGIIGDCVKSMLAHLRRECFVREEPRRSHLSPFSSLTVSLAVSESVGGAGCDEGTLMNMGMGVEGGSGRVAIVSAPEFTSSIALRSCKQIYIHSMLQLIKFLFTKWKYSLRHIRV